MACYGSEGQMRMMNAGMKCPGYSHITKRHLLIGLRFRPLWQSLPSYQPQLHTGLMSPRSAQQRIGVAGLALSWQSFLSATWTVTAHGPRTDKHCGFFCMTTATLTNDDRRPSTEKTGMVHCGREAGEGMMRCYTMTLLCDPATAQNDSTYA